MMVFNKKVSKGIKGVFSGKDVERYINEIDRLERACHLKDITIARLDTQLSGVVKELSGLRKQVLKQDTTIQGQRAELADVRVALADLETPHDALVQEKKGALDQLRLELERAPSRSEFDAVKQARARLDAEVADLRSQLARRDDQIHRLTGENLKLKDRLKFLKEEGA